MKTFFIEVTKRNSGEKYEEPSAHRKVCHWVCLRHEGHLTKKVIIIQLGQQKILNIRSIHFSPSFCKYLFFDWYIIFWTFKQGDKCLNCCWNQITSGSLTLKTRGSWSTIIGPLDSRFESILTPILSPIPFFIFIIRCLVTSSFWTHCAHMRRTTSLRR